MLSSPESQSRKLQVVAVAAVSVLAAVGLYFSGGNDGEKKIDDPTQDEHDKGFGFVPPPDVPNTDNLYPNPGNDVESTEPPELPDPKTDVASADTDPTPGLKDPLPGDQINGLADAKTGPGTAGAPPVEKDAPATTGNTTSPPAPTTQDRKAPGTGTGKSPTVAENNTPAQTDQPQDKPGLKDTAPSKGKAPLTLKQPKKPMRGIVAHTETVITEDEYESTVRPRTPAPNAGPSAPKAEVADVKTAPAPDLKPSPMAAPAPQVKKPRVVKVTKEQAQTFARRATATWQAEGRIPPTQRFRLPKQQETASPRVWREEDAPATPKERRTFGLVLADTTVEAAPAARNMTPEGIPVRNVPEGESALKKGGPDKPLWKRPE